MYSPCYRQTDRETHGLNRGRPKWSSGGQNYPSAQPSLQHGLGRGLRASATASIPPQSALPLEPSWSHPLSITALLLEPSRQPRVLLTAAGTAPAATQPLSLAVGAILVAGEVERGTRHLGRRTRSRSHGGERPGHGPGALLLELERVVTLGHANVAHLTPVLAPRVTNDPVLAGVGVVSPADHRDDVVNPGALLGVNSPGVLEDRRGIDTARDRATVVDLLGHGGGAGDRSVLGDGSVGVRGEACAEAVVGDEGGAGAGDVLGRARPVHVGADASGRLARARQVRVRGLVGDATPRGLGEGMQPLVWPVDRAAVARSDAAAVENVLHREVDVDALRVARDLDPISQRRDGAVVPAGAAVLRDVLVAAHREIVHTVLVAPRERLGQLDVGEHLVGGVDGRVAAPHHARLLRLRLAPHLRSVRVVRGDECGGEGDEGEHGFNESAVPRHTTP